MVLLCETESYQHEKKSFSLDPDVSWKNNSIIGFFVRSITRPWNEFDNDIFIF